MKIVRYHRRVEDRPATIRRILARDLASALAHQKANHPERARSWTNKLIDDLVVAKLLAGLDVDAYRAELRRRVRQP